MDNNKESLGEKLIDVGVTILGILFVTFFVILALGLVAGFNYLFWDFTFWLVNDKYLISGFFAGVLSVCVTVASIVGMLTFIIWLFTNKDED